MAKILIVSDSHRWTEEVAAIKNKHQTEVELMIHCGDSELSEDHQEMSGFITVRGNCDYDQRFPEEAVVDIAGHKLLVTHGHLHAVKSTLMRLYYRAREVGANIVLFGHSHMLGMEQIDDILFINPGSIKLPRGRKERTYCILELNKDQAEVVVYDIKTGEIPDLKSKFSLVSQE